MPRPSRRAAACVGSVRATCLAAWLVVVLLARVSAVVVTSVQPNRGSLAGGTRLHIQVARLQSACRVAVCGMPPRCAQWAVLRAPVAQRAADKLPPTRPSFGCRGRALKFAHTSHQGSGFSTNTGGTGNIIRIGTKYLCDPIPLHCTVNQIACKTRPALEGCFLVFVAF